MQSLTAGFPFKGGWRWSTGHKLKSPFSLVIYERTNTIFYMYYVYYFLLNFSHFSHVLTHSTHTKHNKHYMLCVITTQQEIKHNILWCIYSIQHYIHTIYCVYYSHITQYIVVFMWCLQCLLYTKDLYSMH